MELGIVGCASDNTVGDVLDVYAQPHDPDVPLLCLDETSKQRVRGDAERSPISRAE